MDCRLAYLIQGVLVEGQPCVMGGPSKSMKTSVSADLAISLASYSDFLGRFRVNSQERVGFISAESGKAVVQETFRRICAAKEISLGTLGSQLVFSTTMPKCDTAGGLQALADFVKSNELTVLILDPAYLAFSGVSETAGNVFSMGGMLLSLAESLTAMGVTLIICHHSRKTREQGTPRHEPLSLEDLAYAGWSEFARQWILVNRREAYVEGSGTHLLWLKTGGSAGHSGLWGVDIDEGPGSALDGRTWNVRVESARDIRDGEKEAKADAKQRAEAKKDQDAMLAMMGYLDTCEGGETVTAWRRGIGFNLEKFNRLLDRLKSDGLIEKTTLAKGGKEFDAWRRKPE